jgi:hypothetical protein
MPASGFGKTSIMIDANGAVVQIYGRATPTELRTHIYLGMIYYEDGEITDVVQAPIVFGHTSTDVTDLFEMNIKTVGLGIEPVDAELQIFMKEGKLFAPGVSHFQDPSCPNLLDIQGLGDINTGAEIIFYNRDYSFRDISTDILEVWDNNGTVESIPGNDATIHRLYISGITNPKLI